MENYLLHLCVCMQFGLSLTVMALAEHYPPEWVLFCYAIILVAYRMTPNVVYHLEAWAIHVFVASFLTSVWIFSEALVMVIISKPKNEMVIQLFKK